MHFSTRYGLTLLAAVTVLGADHELMEAQGPRWQVLGRRTVNHTADRDEITVTVREGKFTHIKLTVQDRAVDFRDMRVHFGDPRGGVFDVQIRKNIPAGGETREIKLPGGSRVIQKVVFWYTSARPGGKRPIVTLHGR